MTTFVDAVPIWTDVTSEEYQLWFEQVRRVTNDNSVMTSGVTDTTISNLRLNAATNEITQGDTLYGYFRRYLHVRFARDAAGTMPIDNAGLFAGDEIFIGTFNTDSTDLPASANFIYRPFTFATGQFVSYELEGGRRIQFSTGIATPPGGIRIDIATVVDLDAIRGIPGQTPVAYYSTQALNARPTQNPAENPSIWDREDVAVTSNLNYNWIILGFEGAEDTRSQYQLSTVGTTGEIGAITPALREEGNIVIDNDAEVRIVDPGNPERFVLDITGNSGTGIPSGFVFPILNMTGDTATFDLDFNTTEISGYEDVGTGEVLYLVFLEVNYVGSTTNETFSILNVAFPAGSNSGPRPLAELVTAANATTGLALNPRTYTLLNPTTIRVTGTRTGIWSVITRTENGFNNILGLSIATPASFSRFRPAGSAVRNGAGSVAPADIQIQVPASAIDETISFVAGLTTKAAIAEDFRMKFNANTNLQVFFNLATLDSDNNVVFETRTNTDIVAMISLIQNSGALVLMQTVTNGLPATFTAPILRVGFDGTRDQPEFTNITLTPGQTATNIRGDITLAINNHNNYAATNALNNTLRTNFNRNVLGAVDNLTVTVVTQGSSNLVNNFFTVNITQAGRDQTSEGSDGGYTIITNGATQTGTLSNRTAEQVIDTIRTVINAGTFFTALETAPTTLNITADAVGPNTLSIVIDPGSGDLSSQFTLVTEGISGGFTPISSINQFRGTDGAQGAFRLDIFRRSATQPAEPTGGTQTTPPTDWSFTIPTGTEDLYQSFVLFNPNVDTPTTNLGTRWSPVFLAGATGPAGESGTSSRVRIIYNDNARTLTPMLPSANNVIDNDWSETPATNSNWFAQQVNVASADGNTIETFGPWRGPSLITGADGVNPTVVDNGDGTVTVTDGAGNAVTIRDGSNGAPGQAGTNGANVLVVYADTADATTNTQSLMPGTNEFVSYFEYRGVAPSLPIRTGITFVRFTGEQGPAGTNGENGENGQSIFPIYASTVNGVNQTFTPNANTEFVTFFESLTRPVLPVTGQTFVEYVGDDGDNVDVVFMRNEMQPTTPDPSPGVPTGWFNTVDDIPSNAIGLIYASYGTRLANATNFTWQAPVQVEGRNGTDGIDGLPGISSVVSYGQRQTEVSRVFPGLTPGSFPYMLTGFNNVNPTTTNWDNVNQIIIGAGTEQLAVNNAIVIGQTHIRVRYDDDNWAYFIIVSSTLVNADNAIQYNVFRLRSRGTILGVVGTARSVGIGFDIAFGEQGPDGEPALAINVALSQNSISQASDGTYPETTIVVNAAFSRGTDEVVTRVMGNIAVDVQGFTRFTAVAGANNIVFPGDTRRPVLVYDSGTRTATLTFANISDTASVVFGFRGQQGQQGIQGERGERGLGGVSGNGLFQSTSSRTQAQLDALTSLQISTEFATANIANRAPSLGDIYIIRGIADAIRAVRYDGTMWIAQAEFIDGNLIVNGTITTDQIAANTITAADIAANTITSDLIAANTITAADIATGTITAESGVIGSLDADTITAGTLSADRLRIDGATLDTDAAGNLVVSTINGGGLTITPGGLGVQVLIIELLLFVMEQLEAIGSGNVPINTALFTGGQVARGFK